MKSPEPWKRMEWRKAARKFSGPDLCPAVDEPYYEENYQKALQETQKIQVAQDRMQQIDWLVDYYKPMQFIEAVFSSTVEEARAILLRHPISLVFCEERLPDGSFREVLGEVKRSAKLVPVVVVSRVGNWEKCLEALRLGAQDYISYPFQEAELESVINQALSTVSNFA